MSNRTQIVVAALLVVAAGVVVGTRLGSQTPDPAADAMEGHDHAAMVAGAGEQSPVRLSPDEARRIGVTLASVERRPLALDVEALGTVNYDETRLATVNPKIEGWIERLRVDFTGAPVERGQPLMDVYSPALVAAQEELVLAARLVQESADGRTADNARALLESARRRLLYWDVSEDEVRRIEDSGEVSRTVTLRSPASGIVVEKNVVDGDRIMPGMNLYRIADLSRVWVEADVFEKDLGLVREGQGATVTFEALPGRSFEASVTYVYPTVSLDARTGRVRLELPNPRGELKPGMYARVALSIPAPAPTVVVPRSAVLATGTRALVFVEDASGALVARAVTTGRTSGRDVEVLAGLTEGERVVSSAAFLVDAESNLGALTAGMEPMEPASDTTDHSGHDMGSMAPDTTDHSGHDMGSMAPDTTDHSGHDMGPMPPDTTAPATPAGG